MSNKQNSLTLAEKIAILDKLKKLPTNLNQRQIATQLNVPRATLQKLITNEAKLRADAADSNNDQKMKRNRTGKVPEVEEALLLWFQKAIAKGLPLSGPILKEKAESLANKMGKVSFKATEGWLHRWKIRNSIVFKRAHGEAKSADSKGADLWNETVIPGLMEKYSSEDIYNADETGLYYRATPDGSLVFRSTTLLGNKKAMERITLLVCSNMSGSDRRKLLVIGKSAQPRCLKGVNMKTLPVEYASNRSAWMTSAIFNTWIKKWDQQLAKQRRNILLIVDNAPSHSKISNLQAIHLVFLPPNTTSLIQPMDQGVIRNLKHFYRQQVSKRLVDALDAKLIHEKSSVADVSRHITILDAILMISTSWKAVKDSTIANCFRKSGFRIHDKELDNEFEDDEINETSLLEDYIEIDSQLQCHEEINADEDFTIIAEVDIKRSRQENPLESYSSDDEDISMVKPSVLLSNLYETERFLVRHGRADLCPKVQELKMEITKIRENTLLQQDIRKFLVRQ